MGHGIALWGFMGCGKTTVGKALARRLGWPFVDLDEVLVATHGPIAAQFVAVGEEVFRRREAEALAQLCDHQVRVLSVGGGTPVPEGNRLLLRASYRTVFLDASWSTLTARVHGAQADARPLWNAAARERYDARRPAYEAADVRVSTDALGVDTVVDRIVEALCNE